MEQNNEERLIDLAIWIVVAALILGILGLI